MTWEDDARITHTSGSMQYERALEGASCPGRRIRSSDVSAVAVQIGQLADIHPLLVKHRQGRERPSCWRVYSFPAFVGISRFKQRPTSSWHRPEPQDSTELGWGTRGQSRCRCQGWLSHFTLCHHSYHNFTPSFTPSWLVTPLWSTSAPSRLYLWFLIIPNSPISSSSPLLFPLFLSLLPSICLLLCRICPSLSPVIELELYFESK